jgi:hypothetical protein
MKPDPHADRRLIRRLKSLPVTEAERARALALVRSGEAIAELCITLSRKLHVLRPVPSA